VPLDPRVVSASNDLKITCWTTATAFRDGTDGSVEVVEDFRQRVHQMGGS